MKRLFFIRESSKGEKTDVVFQAGTKIQEALAQRYDLTAKFDLGKEHVEIVKTALSQGKRFDAIVTHIPPSIEAIRAPYWSSETEGQSFSRCYYNSGNILDKIKELDSRVPIIAYTGIILSSAVHCILLEEWPLHKIISRSRPELWESDLQKIFEAVEKYTSS